MLAEIVAWQPPSAGSRPVPIGSRFIGVSLQPAIPRRVAPQQSPLPLHQSPTILAQSQSGEAIKCAAQPHCKDAAQAVAPRLVVAPALAVSAANRSVISTLRAGCHFYLAPTARTPPTPPRQRHSQPVDPSLPPSPAAPSPS